MELNSCHSRNALFQVTGVVVKTGDVVSTLPATLVVVGVGARANVELFGNQVCQSPARGHLEDSAMSLLKVFDIAFMIKVIYIKVLSNWSFLLFSHTVADHGKLMMFLRLCSQFVFSTAYSSQLCMNQHFSVHLIVLQEC